MLVHYRCGRCGGTLAALDMCEGQTLPCSLCRHPNTVPHVERAVTQEQLNAAAEDSAYRRFSAYIAQQTDEEARRIAWAEARRAAGRGRTWGAIVTVLGAIPSVLALIAIISRSTFGFTLPSLTLSVIFGSFAMLIGAGMWRSGQTAVQEAFRQAVPIVADRLRREHWQAWETQQQAGQPTTPEMPTPAPLHQNR